jgi:hypothetical protein
LCHQDPNYSDNRRTTADNLTLDLTLMECIVI